jgi:hypothetical protein
VNFPSGRRHMLVQVLQSRVSSICVILLALLSDEPALAVVRNLRSSTALVPSDLKGIIDIKCLKARLADPNATCYDSPDVTHASAVTDTLLKLENVTLLNFPSYQAPLCNSGGEYFCDPYNMLNFTEQGNVASVLQSQRQQHLVICPMLDKEPINQQHLEPFFLGVVITKDAPDTDTSTLMDYASIIMNDWNMNAAEAAPQQTLRCHNAGLLLIFPKLDKAVLATDTCQYMCGERSTAPAVILNSLSNGDSLADAVTAGIEAAYKELKDSTIQGEAMPTLSSNQTTSQGDYITAAQQAATAFTVAALLMGLIVSSLVLVFAPGAVINRKR